MDGWSCTDIKHKLFKGYPPFRQTLHKGNHIAKPKFCCLCIFSLIEIKISVWSSFASWKSHPGSTFVQVIRTNQMIKRQRCFFYPRNICLYQRARHITSHKMIEKQTNRRWQTNKQKMTKLLSSWHLSLSEGTSRHIRW